MNKRIQELAEQAGLEMWINGNDEVEIAENQKKFAELIVRECIQAVDNVGGFNEEFHMNAIKEHFGVAE